VHTDQPRGGPHAVAIGQMSDQVDGLVLGQARGEQRSPLPLGEAGLAGAAVELLTGLHRQAAVLEVPAERLAAGLVCDDVERPGRS
jgi:hypothetical protein